MKKSLIALVLTLCLLLPAVSLADKLRTDIPDWTEDAIKQYLTDYMIGEPEKLDELWGMYNLQVRRYMPPKTFVHFLSELKWMTGDFLGFGEYEAFEETDLQTKTHILRLDMEKVDLDLFLTHETEDNEIINLEFVPVAAEEETTQDDAQAAPAETENEEETDE